MKLTPEQLTRLKQASIEALKTPYPKDSKGVFAAAVLTTTNKIFASAQYFSDTYSLTLHAEQAALAHAAAHGQGEIIAIAITSNQQDQPMAYPCHMCKQLLWESHLRSKQPMTIIVFDQQGNQEQLNLDDIINYPWPPKK